MQQTFQLKPSRQLLLCLVISHALALIAIIVSPLPLWVQVALPTLLLVSLIHQIKQLVNPVFMGLKWADQELLLVKCNGELLSLQRDGDSLVMPSLIVLRGILPSGVRQNILMMSDSLASKEDFRRLRVLLRWR